MEILNAVFWEIKWILLPIYLMQFYRNGYRYDIIVRGRDYSVDLTLSASFDRLSLSLSAFVSY